jgi:vancomycin permeability regulator SanA/competence protein ComGC
MSDKRKTLYLIILLSVLIIVFVILLAIRKAHFEPAGEAASQDTVTVQDENDTYDTETVTVADADMESLQEEDEITIPEEEAVQNIPGDVWKSAFEIYEKKCNCMDTIEEVSSQLYEIAENDAELGADILAMEEVFSYWDRANEKDYVNDDLIDNLPNVDSLCIVILGYSLSPKGEVRDELKMRLDAGIEAAERYPNAYILVTGGGTALLAPTVKEADKMAEYLIDNGIDPSRIIIENNSLSTSENAVYSEILLRNEYPEINKIFIVTSDYHVPMACAIFEGWFIMKGSNLRVISNYACDPGNPTVFRIKDQVYWMKELLYFL